MTHILLTGAGFSHNWGGWLASEAFEYLLGCCEITRDVRDLLWRKKLHGGFEGALSELQMQSRQHQNDPTQRALSALQSAVLGMFNVMNQALGTRKFEFQNDLQYQIGPFLGRFDAIFTLNQDLLLEQHYLNDNITLANPSRWNGGYMPHIKLLNPNPHTIDRNWQAVAKCIPDSQPYTESPRFQPIFKLHGSSNWVSEDGPNLLILGGDKAAEVAASPLLHWYHQKFREYLRRGGAQLMVIGYSFGDEYINNAIVEAVNTSGLRLFIVDPLGVDVLHKQPPQRQPSESLLESALRPAIIGASRRRLSATFSSDIVEHRKLMRFFGLN
jgi:hypothetical protein